MKESRPEPKTLNTRHVPKELKKDFKAWCGEMDYTMENCVIALMRKSLEDDKPIPNARLGRCEKDYADGVSLHTRSVPPHLKAQFKGWCARRGYSMEDAVMALVRRTLSEGVPVPGADTKSRVGG